MKYIGPQTRQGLQIGDKLWKEPWKWKPEEIEQNCKKQPELKKYFIAEEKKK